MQKRDISHIPKTRPSLQPTSAFQFHYSKLYLHSKIKQEATELCFKISDRTHKVSAACYVSLCHCRNGIRPLCLHYSQAHNKGLESILKHQHCKQIYSRWSSGCIPPPQGKTTSPSCLHLFSGFHLQDAGPYSSPSSFSCERLISSKSRKECSRMIPISEVLRVCYPCDQQHPVKEEQSDPQSSPSLLISKNSKDC